MRCLRLLLPVRRDHGGMTRVLRRPRIGNARRAWTLRGHAELTQKRPKDPGFGGSGPSKVSRRVAEVGLIAHTSASPCIG